METTTPARRARPSLPRRSEIALLALLFVGCPSPAEEPYRVVQDRLDEGLLSVSGTSPSDVWIAGSDAGSGPLVLHWDGRAWERRDTGQSGDLWWVHASAEGPVFLGGNGGMILRYQDGAFERMTTPSDAVTVFGIWAASPSDVYAVGGVAGGNGFVWHYDGSAWSAIALPADHMGQAVFKVWGLASDDVWICGFGGILYHFDGTAWTRVESSSMRTLLTLHVIDGAATAVGGAGTGVLVERAADGTWHDSAPDLTPQLMGVWLTPDGGRASGINGTILRRSGGTWSIEEHGLDLAEHLHSVWIDPDGGVWSVGGQILSEPFYDGVIVYQGPQAIPPVAM